MSTLLTRNLDYDRPIRIADDVYWVGFPDPARGLYCNPYLILDGEEGVLIDGGSRPEFTGVMMKILQTGIAPGSISTLIYQHYDPDLCGSIAHLEEIIARPDLRIVSKRESNVFIRYYGVKTQLSCIDELGRRLVLPSGRTLRFIHVPYAHTPGSFMTYDEKTRILFTGDLLGSFEAARERELFRELPDECLRCDAPLPADDKLCPETSARCPLRGIADFHLEEMSSNRALRLACKRILDVPAEAFAPQHGSVWHRRADVEHIVGRLVSLTGVGIDGVPDD